MKTLSCNSTTRRILAIATLSVLGISSGVAESPIHGVFGLTDGSVGVEHTPNLNAAGHGTSGYLTDGSGEIIRGNTGDCWRTGYWTPEYAIPECDPQYFVKKAEVKMEPKVEPIAQQAVPPVAPVVVSPPQIITIQSEKLFDFDKATLREGSVLDEVASKMENAPKTEIIVITGHTDRLGSKAYNMKLSQQRADAVKDYLVNKGMNANNIETVAKGEAESVTTNCVGSRNSKKLIVCLQPDRRVAIENKVKEPSQVQGAIQ